MSPITLGKLLHFPVDPNHPIAMDANSDIRHGEFLQRLSRLVLVLKGIEAHSWLLYIEDSAEFALALLALLCAGKQLRIAPNRQEGLIQQLAADSDATLSDIPLTHNTYCLEDLLGRIDTTENLSAMQPLDATVTITMITSGSTGEPKLVSKNLGAFVAEIEALESLWGSLVADGTVFSTVSHQHVYGLLFRLMWPLACGRILRRDTHMYPEMLFADMANTSKAVLVSSPAHLRRIPDAIEGSQVRDRLAMVFSSGGPLAEGDSQNFFHRFGKIPVEVFGSTETGGVAFRQQDGSATGSIWHVLPQVSIRQDEATQCLEVYSPFVSGQDWFLMGDRIDWIDERRFFHRGRADRIVKIEEKRVSLTAMEEQLKRHVMISDARIILLQDCLTRQQLGAVVVLADHDALPGETDRLALNRQWREYLLPFFERSLLPRKWRYVKSLPVNSQGKVVQSDLQMLFADRSIFPRENIPAQMLLSDENPTTLVAHLDTALYPWIFDGHFSEMPILPGVMQMDWVIKLAQQHWYPQALFTGVSRIKFSRPIQPNDFLEIRLTHDGKGKVQYQYCCGAQEMSSGSFSFRTNT